MEYLDELYEGAYGLLLFKGDPTEFRLGRDEWLVTTRFEGDDHGPLPGIPG